ncbi:MAG: fumarylacetoacetate hydrolase family protein [Herpetosiphonaceae bacterium]|nr:fumarylacetoacetate hydrolase family protein [Herpetosiphonaceae bacterium]
MSVNDGVAMNERVFLALYDDQWCIELDGVTHVLSEEIPSLDWVLANLPASEVMDRLLAARGALLTPQPATCRAPVGKQEVWASGVTYKRSEEARERESQNSTIYTRVYHAERPELFFKAFGPEVVSSGEAAGIRFDATWSVPEPELVVVFNKCMEVIGFTVGNDLSSRDIEGENPLYLPQAKVYERACVLGPRIWLQPGAEQWPEVDIRIVISRAGETVFSGETATSQIKRSLAELGSYLGRCRRFPAGVFLFSGTGIVPPDAFSLAVGDEVRITIDAIGELINPIMIVGTP